MEDEGEGRKDDEGKRVKEGRISKEGRKKRRNQGWKGKGKKGRTWSYDWRKVLSVRFGSGTFGSLICLLVVVVI